MGAWDKDRYMSPDICKAKNLLREEKIWNAVKMHMDNYHRKQVYNLLMLLLLLFHRQHILQIFYAWGDNYNKAKVYIFDF